MNIFFSRDRSGTESNFEPLAIIEHRGRMTSDGDGQGHYICDVKHKNTQNWFRTNDNENPLLISISNVSKRGVVVLYKKIPKD